MIESHNLCAERKTSLENIAALVKPSQAKLSRAVDKKTQKSDKIILMMLEKGILFSLLVSLFANDKRHNRRWKTRFQEQHLALRWAMCSHQLNRNGLRSRRAHT